MCIRDRFWRDFRKAVKEAKPDALILAEHYGDPSSWLDGDQWDTVMNYDAFMEPLTWFLTGMEKHSDERHDEYYGDGELFFQIMFRQMSRFHVQSLQVAMNELSNHDHSRFLTRTNRTAGRTGTLGPEAAEAGIKKGVLRMAVVVQMTWPGAPTIYYGDEAGLCGWTDPDNRRGYPWGREDLELIEFHKYLTRIRKSNPALKMCIRDRFGVADGMGSGRRAFRDSEVVMELAEQLLSSGFSLERAIRLMNAVLLLKDQEQRPITVDLAVADLYSGVDVYKRQR